MGRVGHVSSMDSEIRISVGGKIKSYVAYALEFLQVRLCLVPTSADWRRKTTTSP